MARVDRRQLIMFLREADEALAIARRIVEGYDIEEFMSNVEARYALRYSLILLVEAIADAVTLILEAHYGVAPDSYRDAMLLAGEKGVIPYDVARELAKLASLRNILVHRYWRVDDERLYRETRKGLESIVKALEALRGYAEASGSRGREEEEREAD